MNSVEQILSSLGEGPFTSAFRVVGLILVLWSVVVGVLAFSIPRKKDMTEVFGQARREQDGRGVRLLARGSEALLIANLMLFVFSTNQIRKHLASGLRSSENPSIDVVAIVNVYNSLAFWSVTTLLGLAAYSFARWSGRRERPVPPWLWLATTQLAFVAFYSLQRTPLTLGAMQQAAHADSPVIQVEILSNALDTSLLFTDLGMFLIVLICLFTAYFWRRSVNKGGDTSESGFAPSVAVFIIGVGLFAFTRGHRFDAHNPIRAQIPLLGACNTSVTRDVPQREYLANVDHIQAPLVRISGPDSGVIDGYAGNLAQLKTVMEDRRKLWDQLKPDEEFPGQVLMVVPRHLPMKDVEPWMTNMQRIGFTRFYAVVLGPAREHLSRTLGKIELSKICWTLQVGREYAGANSWDEHVTAASRSLPVN